MSDTSPEAARVMRDRLASKTPGERVRMATGMFAAARALVWAGLEPHSRAEPFRVTLLRRFYGSDLPDRTLRAAALKLTQVARGKDAPQETGGAQRVGEPPAERYGHGPS